MAAGGKVAPLARALPGLGYALSLAIGLDMSLAFGSPLLMLDLRTGRLTRLPAPSYSPGRPRLVG